MSSNVDSVLLHAAGTATRPNEKFEIKVSSAMNSPPEPPIFDTLEQEREWVKFRLAQAFRIFARHGFFDGASGHITVRDPINTKAFWANPLGIHFGLITPDVLLLVDEQGAILPESGRICDLDKAALMVHSAIHRARPDIHCVAQSYSPYGQAFATLGVELQMFTQTDCIFYQDCPVYKKSHTSADGDYNHTEIAQNLGSKKAAIIQDCGLLTVSSTIEGAVMLFIRLEDVCEGQIASFSSSAGLGPAAKPVPISHEEAIAVRGMIARPQNAYFAGLGEFSIQEEKEQGALGEWNGAKPKFRLVHV